MFVSYAPSQGVTMHHWTKRLFAIAAPLLLTGCLWGPGKFNSDLTVRKDGTFVLDYRGEIVIQIPKDEFSPKPWTDNQAYCFEGRRQSESPTVPVVIAPPAPAPPQPSSAGRTSPPVIVAPKRRTCTPAEIAQQREAFEKNQASSVERKRSEAQSMAKMFGLPGLDDESSREFAAKLTKYAGWRSVRYRGNGVFDVDYHFVGSAKQDFLFPSLPDNDLLIPFIAIRRRADGSVLVTAPEFVGGAGPLGTRAASLPGATRGMPVSRAQGRFTVITDGEILTNNSEDGAAPHPIGRQLHWDIGPASNKIPETLIRL
jgi:hypothetical protein